MMLKTSYRKINPFLKMITFTNRKNLGIIIVLCIAALIYFPGTFIVDYENLIVSAQNNSNNYLLENFGIVLSVCSAVIAVLFNMMNFNFLYKKSSSDVFHAFPLTRTELFLSRFISGLLSTLVPTILCYLSFGILLAFNSWMGSFTGLLYYLLHNVIIILVCSSFSMIFVISAGSAFDLGVSLIGGNLALIAVGWIFESILDETLVGYNGYTMSDIMYNLSPPYFCGVGLGLVNNIIQDGINGQNIEFFIRSIVYIVLFSVVSLLLYNRRKSEKGGTAYAYKFMYLGCSILAGICGGFLLGMMFIGNITSLGFWFFTIVGCLLTSVIYGTVTNRGFKGVVKSILMGALSAIVLISVAVSGITGGFGYTKRIPHKDKIKNVSVSVFDENIPFDNPQVILDLHKAILDTAATDFETSYIEYSNGNNTQSVPYYQTKNVIFYYELENGKTMSRNFNVYAPKVANELLKIYKSNQRLKMIKDHINLAEAYETSLYFFYNNEYYNVDITLSEAHEFVNAYWKDVKDCDKSIFDNQGYEFIEISSEKKLDDNRSEWYGFQLEFHDSFTNTKLFIENHQLISRSIEQQTQKY